MGVYMKINKVLMILLIACFGFGSTSLYAWGSIKKAVNSVTPFKKKDKAKDQTTPDKAKDQTTPDAVTGAPVGDFNDFTAGSPVTDPGYAGFDEDDDNADVADSRALSTQAAVFDALHRNRGELDLQKSAAFAGSVEKALAAGEDSAARDIHLFADRPMFYDNSVEPLNHRHREAAAAQENEFLKAKHVRDSAQSKPAKTSGGWSTGQKVGAGVSTAALVAVIADLLRKESWLKRQWAHLTASDAAENPEAYDFDFQREPVAAH